jgi:hypothetical protein
MMEHMPPSYPVVSLPLIPVQAVPEVAVLRDRMHRIIDHLKWTKKLVYVCIVVLVYEILMK